MRLLIVGSNKVYSIENFYVKYIGERSVTVECFTAQAIFYDYYYGGTFFRKLLVKVGLSSIFKKINLLFKEKIDEFKPDIIWVFKGMEIWPESIIWAKNRGIKLVNYNPDNPFIFTGAGSGNKNVTKSIHLYDFHFTYNLIIKRELEDRFNLKTAFLPFGYDVSDKLYNECLSETEILRTCFLGNPDDSRAAILNKLANSGIKIDLYGNNWSKFIKNDNVTIFEPVYGNDLWKILRKYRVQLNLMRIHNENSHNMRTFEVPGIGGIMIAPDTVEHRIFFKDGEEVFLYKNIEHCVSIINHILSLSKDEANIVRNSARKRSSNYTYQKRAFEALEVIKGI